jgi:hypothetical protein
MWEFIIVIYNDMKNRSERKYGIIYGEDEKTALAKLGAYYEGVLCRIEYFGFGGMDAEDVVYEFNDEYADRFDISGRKFGKIIPPLNDIPDDKIYE